MTVTKICRMGCLFLSGAPDGTEVMVGSFASNTSVLLQGCRPNRLESSVGTAESRRAQHDAPPSPWPGGPLRTGRSARSFQRA